MAMEKFIIGIDYGEKRSGVAELSTVHGLPKPLGVFETGKLIRFLNERSSIDKIVVGFPLNLKGELTEITLQSIKFAEKLQRSLNKRVFLIDERFSSSQSKSLFKLNPKGKKFKDVKDAFSACLILESFYCNPSMAFEIDRNFDVFPEKLIENIRGKKVLISNKKYKLDSWVKKPEKLLFQTKDPYYFFILSRAKLEALFCDFNDIPNELIKDFDLIL